MHKSMIYTDWLDLFARCYLTLRAIETERERDRDRETDTDTATERNRDLVHFKFLFMAFHQSITRYLKAIELRIIS